MYASHWLNIPSKCCVVPWYTTATYVIGILPLESRCDRYLNLGTMVFCTMYRTLGEKTKKMSRLEATIICVASYPVSSTALIFQLGKFLSSHLSAEVTFRVPDSSVPSRRHLAGDDRMLGIHICLEQNFNNTEDKTMQIDMGRTQELLY